MMVSEPSSLRIREALDRLVQLIDESCTCRVAQWAGEIMQRLDQLEQALRAQAAEPLAFEFLKETAEAHPRLISLCARLHEDGRSLLRQAAFVVLLSVRTEQTGMVPQCELRKATALFIDAVRRHQDLESELIGEVDRDIGGEG